MKFKVDYNIYTDEKNRAVIAVCRYAGRSVRGVAKCSPDDEFDLDYGTRLAIARCEEKIARIKIRNASIKYLAAAKAADEAEKRFSEMKQYYMDSVDQLDNAIEEVKKISNEIK